MDELAQVKSDVEEVKTDIAELKADVHEIKDNHLNCIENIVLNLKEQIANLRWFILASLAVMGVVLAILEVCG